MEEANADHEMNWQTDAPPYFGKLLTVHLPVFYFNLLNVSVF
jgi:hypothetical protein